MHQKIDIYVNGEYAVSTTRSKTCREAVQQYRRRYPGVDGKITATFA